MTVCHWHISSYFQGMSLTFNKRSSLKIPHWNLCDPFCSQDFYCRVFCFNDVMMYCSVPSVLEAGWHQPRVIQEGCKCCDHFIMAYRCPLHLPPLLPTLSSFVTKISWQRSWQQTLSEDSHVNPATFLKDGNWVQNAHKLAPRDVFKHHTWSQA